MSGPHATPFITGLSKAKAIPPVTSPLVLKSIKDDRSFEGFGFDDNATENSGVRFIPPDPIGAAGKRGVIGVVNAMIEARTKSGKLKWRDGLSGFFAPLGPLTFTFDPKVVYDQYEDRFVVVTLEVVVDGNGDLGSIDSDNISRILLAVSKNGKPKTPTAADWHYLAIDAKQVIFPQFGGFDGFADYPGFEVDEEAVYITANMFTIVPFGFFGGVRLWIVDKGVSAGGDDDDDDGGGGGSGFYAGGPAVVTAHDPYATAGVSTTTMPAHVFAPSGGDDDDDGDDDDSFAAKGGDDDDDGGRVGVGGPGSTIGTFLVSYSGLTNGVDEFVQVVRVDDPLGTSGGPFFVQEFLNIGSIEAVPPFPALPDAPQDGTPFLIEVNDRRALDAVWRDNMLWLTTTINPESGPNFGQTTAHWFKLNTSAVTSSASPADLIMLDQQGNIGGEDIAPGTFTFFPAVAVNRNGEAKFGFSASAPSIFAGAFVTGRQPGDAPGTVQGSETVKAGEGPYERFFGGSRNRWGDYSGISVDPSNDKFFWVFNQFADTPGSVSGGEDGRWGTAWA